MSKSPPPIPKLPTWVAIFIFGGFAASVGLFVLERQHIDKIFHEKLLWWSSPVVSLGLCILLNRVLRTKMPEPNARQGFLFFLWLFLFIGLPISISFVNRVQNNDAPVCRNYIVVGGEKAWMQGASQYNDASYNVTLNVDEVERSFYVKSAVYFNLHVGDSIQMCSAKGRLGLPYAVSFKNDWLHIPPFR